MALHLQSLDTALIPAMLLVVVWWPARDVMPADGLDWPTFFFWPIFSPLLLPLPSCLDPFREDDVFPMLQVVGCKIKLWVGGWQGRVRNERESTICFPLVVSMIDVCGMYASVSYECMQYCLPCESWLAIMLFWAKLRADTSKKGMNVCPMFLSKRKITLQIMNRLILPFSFVKMRWSCFRANYLSTILFPMYITFVSVGSEFGYDQFHRSYHVRWVNRSTPPKPIRLLKI